MAKAVKQAAIAAIVAGIIVGVTLGTGGAGAFASFANFAGISSGAAAFVAFSAVSTFVATGINMMTAKDLPSGLSGNFGAKVSSKNPNAPRQIVYGECRVAGTYTQIQTSGTDNSVLHVFAVLAGHQINSLEKVIINDKVLTLGSSTSSSTINSETVHTVTESFFTNTDNPNNLGSGRLIRFTFHDGSQTAVDGFAQAQLDSTSVPNTHIFKDCAYVYMQMVYDSELLPNFPNLSFQVKGKNVHDPRTGSAVSDDAGRSNPALCLRDYLTDTTYGLGATSDEINDTTSAGGFAAAANTCDQDVTLADGSSTEDRYTCNGFTDFASSGETITAGILSSMAGTMTYSNGKFNCFAGANQTASLTITDDDCLRPINVVTNSISGDLANTVKAIFPDASQKFVPTDTPILQNSTLLNADTPSGESTANFVKTMEVRLPFTTSNTMAQRLAKIALLHQRETTVIKVVTNLNFLRLQPTDYVQVTNSRLSFSNKLFEVIAVNMVVDGDENPVLACELDLKEISTSVYDFATNEYSTIQAEGSDLTSGALTVSAPTASSINQTATIDGPNVKINIKVTWTNASNEAIQGTIVQYKLAADSNYSSFMVGKGETIGIIPNVTVGDEYTVRIKHQTFDGVTSAVATYSNITIAAPTAAPDSPTSASVTTNNALSLRVQWTNPSNKDLRAVKVYQRTANTTPTDDTHLIQTIYGAPSSISKADFGVQDGLALDTTHYFWVRAINHSGTHSSGFVSAGNGVLKKVDTGQLEDDSVELAQMANNSVDTDQIVDDAVDAAQLNTDSVRADAIKDGEVGDGALGTNINVGSHALSNSIGTGFFDMSSGIISVSNVSSLAENTWLGAAPYHNSSSSGLLGGSAKKTSSFTTGAFSGNRTHLLIFSATPVGSYSGDEEIATAVAMRENNSSMTSNTASDYVVSTFLFSTGRAAQSSIYIASSFTAKPSTTYNVAIFCQMEDTDTNSAGQRGLAFALVQVIGLAA